MKTDPRKQWTLAEKIAFRFFFILFTLFIFFFNNSVLPVFDLLARNIAGKIVPWVSSRFLSLDFVPTPGNGGSGDTTYSYIMLLVIVILAAVGCLAWSLTDKKRTDYNRLLYWLTVLVRFYIGIMLIHYGIAKIIKVQFASPDLIRLISPYGDSSPMGLAWTFLGFSDGYNTFMGIIELSCGLLLFRRTVILGAIIALMASANIMAVNYFFDVPVKIVSTALVLMSLFLLAPNFQRLIDFFLRGKAVSLKAPVYNKRWLLNSKIIFKYVLIILCILPTVTTTLGRRKLYGDAAPKLPLYGVYIVESFESAKPIPKWDKLIIQRSDYSAIMMEHNTIEYCSAAVDTVKRQLEIAFNNEPNTIHRFSYSTTDSENLELTGVYFAEALKVKLKKQHFQLTERPFRWIAEDPYNR